MKSRGGDRDIQRVEVKSNKIQCGREGDGEMQFSREVDSEILA